MKYIHNFFENFLRLLLVGLHGFTRVPWFAPDMLPLVYGEMRWKQRQDENCKVVEILQKSYSFWLYETLQIARINHMRAGYHRSIDHKKNILLLLRQLPCKYDNTSARNFDNTSGSKLVVSQ
jgi:hypothetical protein